MLSGDLKMVGKSLFSARQADNYRRLIQALSCSAAITKLLRSLGSLQPTKDADDALGNKRTCGNSGFSCVPRRSGRSLHHCLGRRDGPRLSASGTRNYFRVSSSCCHRLDTRPSSRAGPSSATSVHHRRALAALRTSMAAQGNSACRSYHSLA